MGAEAAKYLWDALQAGERAQRFALGMDYDAYCADEVRRSAIERQLEILGEALLQLRKVDPETAARIPELHRAVALRHVLIHGYANVDNNIVWGVVRQHLDPLLLALRNLHDSAGSAPNTPPASPT
jgi:uncharacterized protein with HEPN domain